MITMEITNQTTAITPPTMPPMTFPALNKAARNKDSYKCMNVAGGSGLTLTVRFC